MRYTIDATNKSIGRLASEIARILQGKDSPRYHPRFPGVGEVRVINVDKAQFTGTKLRTKIYRRHTGYMGHLKEQSLEEAIEKDPAGVLRRAVYNMLPKNRLRRVRLLRLSISSHRLQ